jgi:serpin B
MMKVTLAVLVFSALILPPAAQAQRDAPAPGQHEPLGVVRMGINDFALKLYARLRSEARPNIIVSPYSISIALSMTQAGAGGATASQIASVLDLPPEWDQERLHWACGELLRELTRPAHGSACRLDIANRLWFEQDVVLLEGFLERLRTQYETDIGQVDFAGHPEQARLQINEWVAKKTENQIRDLCPPGTITPYTLLVLANAIYFKGAWDLPFDPKDTKTARFEVSAKDAVEVPMMTREADFPYASEETLQILEMTYADRAFSMILLLPRRADGLKQVEEMLTSENLARWEARLRKKRVHVDLPRFRATSRHPLVEPLKGMGLTLLFSEKADLSRMTAKPGIRLSDIIHQAALEVNEEGTVASAATAAVIPRSLTGPPVFRADHPFVFLIREGRHGVILFMGRVSNPRAS